ncbi:TolB family protein [Maribellus mangrovi]|uniref:TolB family protein n=1 Tax=Maribellus mangrovi TaxID=3133146 RepID=UPI0030EF54FB
MNTKFSSIAIGNPVLKGNTIYHNELQTFTLKGAGENMWFDNDEFWFVFQKVKGDFIFSANVQFVGEGVNPHRKIGLMARSDFDANSAYVNVCVHGDGLTGMQFREKKGENTDEIPSELNAPQFIQLERKGDTYIVRISKDRQPLITVAEKQFDLGAEVSIGMFICSHDTGVVETAKFSNVRIEIPAAEGVDGYRNPSPSRLEILEVASGNRKIIYETDEHIEAPNWSRDGKFLIYNSDGKLYKFDAETMKPEEINTGFAQSNNNDHGISFDGKTLAISNHVEENGVNHSIIYTVPIEGGTPKRITEKGPSYWHGWSPDGKWLTYCAERNGNYDVYKIPSAGGKEIRLTTIEGLDDGPEYSPDGKYIYFNSTRSGMMQIWRMKPDGSEQEQVTFDNYQNWFAHPSPNGKWLIMISYPPEVPAASHPHNQRVMLRLMPADGGEIKVVAFLYGGQGTINVPSWSPDSKKVAFVSYTY